jgi:hypothetical protein
VQASALEATGSALPSAAAKDVSITNVWPCASGECTVRFTASSRATETHLSVTVEGLNGVDSRVQVYSRGGIQRENGKAHALTAANVVLALLRGDAGALECHSALRLLDEMWVRSIQLHRTYSGQTFQTIQSPLLGRLFKLANPVSIFGVASQPSVASADAKAAEPTLELPKAKRKRQARNPRKNAAQSVSCTCVNCVKTYALLKRLADKGANKTCSKKCSYEYRTAKSLLTRAANKAKRLEAEQKQGYPYTNPGYPFPVYPSGLPEGGSLATPVHLPPQRRFDKYGCEMPPSGE